MSTPSLGCFLAELYVVAATTDIGVDEPDLVARRLYESLGLSNREEPDGPVMYVYERELRRSCVRSAGPLVSGRTTRVVQPGGN
jgi:hypothetical protein